jgi:hypothetical protein
MFESESKSGGLGLNAELARHQPPLKNQPLAAICPCPRQARNNTCTFVHFNVDALDCPRFHTGKQGVFNSEYGINVGALEH